MLDTQIPADSSLERCADLWFEDCGLIVRADHTLFRVSAAMLGAQSAVFADMREFKQPDDAEKIDGCPVLRLPDPAREVRVFFKALFDPSSFRDYPARTDYPTLEGVLHLSHKYEVPFLKKRALTHLGSVFYPSQTTVSSWTLEFNQFPSILNLCSEVDAPWILVPACYAYCHFCTVHDVILGTTVEDRHVVLSPDLQIAIISATNMLRTEKMSQFLDFIRHPDYLEKCRTPAKCLTSRNTARFNVEKTKGQRLPDQVYDSLNSTEWHQWVCPPCTIALERGLKSARRKLKAGIPGLFGYPDWDILDKHKSDFFEDLGV